MTVAPGRGSSRVAPGVTVECVNGQRSAARIAVGAVENEEASGRDVVPFVVEDDAGRVRVDP